MEPLLLGLNGWLEAAGVAGWARSSASVYPVANVAHVLGVVMLVGAIGIVDLRIVGFWRRLPLVPLSRALTPLALAGLAMQVASGTVLFAADGEALAASGTFHAKLILLTLVLANALAFRIRWRRARPGDLYAASATERASAAASLALWLAIATLGRLIAYY